MKKKEPYSTRPIRRINLSLPFLQTDSYEIYHTVPPAPTRQSSNVRPVSRHKPLINNGNNVKFNHPTPSIRPPGRLKNLTGSVLVNLFVDIPPMPADSPFTMADTISNALINSGYSGQTLRTLPSIKKHNKLQSIKDDGEKSQTSSGDRLFYESVNSFEDPFMNRAKNGMWHNVHHPQFASIKVLHTRKKAQHINDSNGWYFRAPNTSSIGNLSQESIISSNERLYDKVEHLTKNYFPVIQQLRHGHPSSDLIHNRMHLHREEKRDFIPILSRSHVGR